MNLFYQLLIPAISLLVLGAIFIPLEKTFPANPGQKIFRKGFILDLSFFVGQYMLWNGLVLIGLSFIDSELFSFIPASLRLAIQSQPFWLQAVEVIFLSDLLVYWGHRLQHRVNFLWRFHKVHHSAHEMDWLAAHREHPLDTIYTVGLINLPAMVMGFPLETISVLIAFRGAWAIYIHSNVRLPIGPLKYIFGAPELHHWHHDKERDRGNYANIFPIMDILFGTHVSMKNGPKEFGIDEPFPENYIGQITAPLLPNYKLSKRVARDTEDLKEEEFSKEFVS